VAVVRSYEAGDLDACRLLWESLTQWHRDLYENQEIGGDDPGRAFDEHLERVGPSNVWVADEDGRVVGLVGLVPGDPPELEPISVAEDFRGRGIGRLLAERVVTVSRERGHARVQVRPVARNSAALRFFHALGFDVLGHIQLELDLATPERWRAGETLAGRTFRY
jgi:GNAT superfamily N-acetyltransferase